MCLDITIVNINMFYLILRKEVDSFKKEDKEYFFLFDSSGKLGLAVRPMWFLPVEKNYKKLNISMTEIVLLVADR